ncbi:MAG: hypothetical protein JO194_01310, partial [Candidatus Eremiobacteraeota bacterium]|nr:hypothetical protein [Candidatus Eremiobacteraeota bacterium]
WSPYNQSNWSPYANGRWAWAQPIGWTWVGYEPWGWAPYHYGRWFYAPAYGWAWYPGPLYGRYFWQPCLVAFFGFGLGGGFNFAVGNLGWVPLAPYEPYYPLYPFNSVNVVQVNNPLKMWSNARAPGGITAITGNSLMNGDYHYVHVGANDLHDVVAARGALPIAPTNAALRYTQNTGTRDVALSPRFAQMPAPKPVFTFAQQRELAASQVNAAIHQAIHQPSSTAQQASGKQPQSTSSHQATAPQNPWTLFEGTHFQDKPQPASQPHGQLDTNPTKDVDPWSRFITGDRTSGAHSPTYLSTMPGITHPLPMPGMWPTSHSGTSLNAWNPHGVGMPSLLAPAPALPAAPALPPPPAPAPASGGHGNH